MICWLAGYSRYISLSQAGSLPASPDLDELKAASRASKMLRDRQSTRQLIINPAHKL